MLKQARLFRSLGTIARVLAVPAAAVCCAMGAAGSAAGSAPGDPIATRQNVFAIPFQVSPARTPAESPRGVQLYVSTDQGANWRLERQVEPGIRRFPFRAPHDGEFWFQVRTIDAQGRVIPEGQQPPGLKVVVDTVSPSIDLTAVEDKPGEVALQWRCTDPWLETNTQKIESQTLASTPWTPVAVNEADVDRAPQSQNGRARFQVPPGANEVTVRLEISDRAGNRATSQALVRLHSRATAQPASLGNNSNANPQPAALPVANQPGVQPWPADQVASRPPLSGSASGAASDAGPTLPAAGSPSGSDLAQPLLPANPSVGSLADKNVLPTPPIHSSSGPLAPPPLVPLTPICSPATAGSAASGPAGAPPPGTAVPATPLAGNTGNIAAPPGQTDVPRSLFDPSLLPAGVVPQQVNVLKFQVDYSVESVGAAGVGRVELWGTRDGGRTWQSFGLDQDNKSPFNATVLGNGLYGFRIVVADANGRGEPAPRNGDAPQIWIAVDASPPDVQIRPPVLRGEQVPILFSVADEQLDPQSVMLFYSHRADGAWIPLTQALGNTGRYDWTPQPGISGPVFLKVEARDRAGNVGSAITREPILLNRPLPKSTISGVRAQ